jgi:holo-[acyl-carrier protein] synthase
MKTGIDIVYIPKFKKLMENEGFIKKTFHKSECKNYKAEHLAGKFATKEAFFKAINKKLDWLTVEVKNDKRGKPILMISDEIKQKYKIENMDISISHDKDYAVASVLII